MCARLNSWREACVGLRWLVSTVWFRAGRRAELTGGDGVEKQCCVSGRREDLCTPCSSLHLKRSARTHYHDSMHNRTFPLFQLVFAKAIGSTHLN